MKYIGLLIAICITIYLLDKLCLFLEERGLLYYRKRKPNSEGLVGNALLELQKIFNPSTQNIIEIKQNRETKQSKENSDKN